MRPVFFLTLIALEATCWRNITPTASGTPSHIQSDTTVIAAYNATLILDNSKDWLAVSFNLAPDFWFDKQKTYLLYIKSVIPHTLPEGVYEVYLSSGKKTSPAKWIPSSTDFVDLINLYGASVEAPLSPLILDITKNLSYKARMDEDPIYSLKVAIVFQGNQMPDGSLIHHEGKLELKKISLLEIK